MLCSTCYSCQRFHLHDKWHVCLLSPNSRVSWQNIQTSTHHVHVLGFWKTRSFISNVKILNLIFLPKPFAFRVFKLLRSRSRHSTSKQIIISWLFTLRMSQPHQPINNLTYLTLLTKISVFREVVTFNKLSTTMREHLHSGTKRVIIEIIQSRNICYMFLGISLRILIVEIFSEWQTAKKKSGGEEILHFNKDDVSLENSN